MHNLEKDQKRLQEALNDKRLLLRYNKILKFCQVWYDAPDSGLYVVLNIPDKYNLEWAIWELKQRQKSRRELQDACLKISEQPEKDFARHNEELSRETAELYSDYKVGKVVTSASTKCLN